MTVTVADIMNPKLLYIQEGDRLSLARAQIVKFGVTAVPVLDTEHRPVGVVSLRDLDPADHGGVEEGARLLAEHGVHHLVVVDEQGIAVGMVSALDFIRAFVREPPHHPVPFERY